MDEKKKELLKFGDVLQGDVGKVRSIYIVLSDPFVQPDRDIQVVYLIYPDGIIGISDAEISNFEKVIE
jgi:hypothetical protein